MIWYEDAPAAAEETLRYGLMLGQARDVADSIIERLRSLHRKFPSPELAEAIQNMEDWRSGLPGW